MNKKDRILNELLTFLQIQLGIIEAMIKDTDENYETELLISLRILEEIKRRNESMITILSCEVQSPLQS
jgi:hypothetical protein